MEYTTAIMSYMAMVFDKTIERGCRLVALDQSTGKFVDTLLSHNNLIKNSWDYAEAEPSDIWNNRT